MILDHAAYKNALLLARGAIVFDVMRHPRDINGRFREVEIKNGKLGSIFSRSTPGIPDNTQDLHTVKDKHGGWHYTKEREAFHKQLIAAYLEGHAAQATPAMLFTAGGAGSGKTTALEKLPDLTPVDSVAIDPDLIKLQIPEYRQLIEEGDPRASALVHDESIDIAQKLLKATLKGKHNALMDGTGASPMFTTRLRWALDAGYEVDVAYFNTDTETALKRIEERKKQTGRGVNEDVARTMHKRASQIFQDVYDLGTSLRIYDTTGPDPNLIAEAEAGADLEVDDPDLFDAFIAKKNETDPRYKMPKTTYKPPGPGVTHYKMPAWKKIELQKQQAQTKLAV